MNLLGLIVEYNPFHNGHLYHLNESKKITNATHTIAVMSGNFMQRGTPALLDKFTRAEMAVKNGVDLVVELPTLYACQSAEIFAHGGISLLNSLNCVNSVCFGSEIGNIDILYLISKILIDEPVDFKNKLKDYLDEGLPFPKARASALFYYITKNKLYDTSKEDLLNMLNSPNNILGIEYIKSILMVDTAVTLFDLDKQVAKLEKKKTEENLQKIVENIQNRKVEINKGNFIKSGISDLTYKMQLEMQKKFTYKQFKVEDHCTGCKTCTKVCPLGNITMENNRPKYGTNCIGCLSCTNNCPSNAIRVKFERSKARYRNKNVSLKEIINSNNQN